MLKRILAGALLFSLFTVGYNNPPTVVLANQAPQATYCSPPNTIMPGAPVASVPVNQNWAHAEQCGGQLGDLWTDGPFYDPSFSYSDSSYAFTIPANVYVVQGQRVATIDAPLTATASATNYVWLSSKTYQYTLTTTNSAPDSYSILEYTIVADGSGITGVTNPTLAALTVNGTLTLSAISSGQCLAATTGGLIQGVSCSGGGVTAVTGTSPITVTAGATPIVSVATPSPSATSTSTAGTPSCAFTSTWPYVLSCNFPVVPATPTPFVQSTPSPSATSTTTTGPPSFTVSGSYPYLYTVNFPSSGVTPTPFPTPSPISTTTAGPPSAIWTAGPQLVINFPAAGGGGGNYVHLFPSASPNPTPSSDPGFAALTGATSSCSSDISALFLGTFQFGSTGCGEEGTALVPGAIVVSTAEVNSKWACESTNVVEYGTTNLQVQSMPYYGNGLTVGCVGGGTDTALFVVDSVGQAAAVDFNAQLFTTYALGLGGPLGSSWDGYFFNAESCGLVEYYADAGGPYLLPYGSNACNLQIPHGDVYGDASSVIPRPTGSPFGSTYYGAAVIAQQTAAPTPQPGNVFLGGTLASQTHNACSATSGVPCEFTWSVSSFSSGIGTTTATVPTLSVCTLTQTQTPVLSSTDSNYVWATLSTNTLTVHVQDQLGTASTTTNGNGTCL